MTTSYTLAAAILVTQQMLREYQDLHRCAQDAEAARQAMRDRIVGLMNSGSTVEPGALVAKIVIQHTRRLTRKAVVAAFGKERYQVLIAGVEPEERWMLYVDDRTSRRRRHSEYPPSREIEEPF